MCHHPRDAVIPGMLSPPGRGVPTTHTAGQPTRRRVGRGCQPAHPCPSEGKLAPTPHSPALLRLEAAFLATLEPFKLWAVLRSVTAQNKPLFSSDEPEMIAESEQLTSRAA